MDCAVNTAAAHQALICRIDDRVGANARDVAEDNFKRAHATRYPLDGRVAARFAQTAFLAGL